MYTENSGFDKELEWILNTKNVLVNLTSHSNNYAIEIGKQWIIIEYFDGIRKQTLELKKNIEIKNYIKRYVCSIYYYPYFKLYWGTPKTNQENTRRYLNNPISRTPNRMMRKTIYILYIKHATKHITITLWD